MSEVLTAERDGVSAVWRAPEAETFVYDDAIVRKFLTATLVWGLAASLVGVILAVELVAARAALWSVGGFRPLQVLGYLTETPWLAYGRLRPVHTNLMVFAFGANVVFAGIYYATQRLCKARMSSDVLSGLHFWGWQAIVAGAALTLLLGINQGGAFGEAAWPIDLAIAVVWIGFFGVNFFGTLARRRVPRMYVSLWFFIASVVVFPVLHLINSVCVPVGVYHFLRTGEVPSVDVLLKSYPLASGTRNAFMQWWYGHNLVTFALVMPLIGMAYYLVPKSTGQPLYSYRLSIVHFWSMVIVCVWAGLAHPALPAWAGTLGMLSGLVALMPNLGGAVNGLRTFRGAWRRVPADPVLKFLVAGIVLFGVASIADAARSIKSVDALVHFTALTDERGDRLILGWGGCIAFGMVYWLVPQLFQMRLWSKRLATAHFWMAVVGIGLCATSSFAEGVTRGLMWRALDQSGTLRYADFVESVNAVLPMYWVRAVGEMVYFAGAVLCAINVWRTWRARPAESEQPVERASAGREVVEPPPQSRLTANINFGHKGDVWLQGAWHASLEARPLKFAARVVAWVGVVSLLVFIPVFGTAAPRLLSVKPFTPLELAGREVFMAEGCFHCHSQVVRPIWAETKRYGEYTKPGELAFDRPVVEGSRRIGPDLAREGGARSHDWHVRHLEDPRSLVPQSIMPSYRHLLTDDLDFKEAHAIVSAMAMLGVPYAAMVKQGEAERLGRLQAEKIAADLKAQGGYEGVAGKKIVALVAYLQRLGTDIKQGPDWDPNADFAPGAGGALTKEAR